MDYFSFRTTLDLYRANNLVADSDKHPDARPTAVRRMTVGSPSEEYIKAPVPTRVDKKESLLTRALLSSPELRPYDSARPISRGDVSTLSAFSITSATSATSMSETSDDDFSGSPKSGALGSPAIHFQLLPPPLLKQRLTEQLELARQQQASDTDTVVANPRELVVEAELGRKRCITFACNAKPATKEDKPDEKPESTSISVRVPPEQAKRPCTIKFACPARPIRESPPDKKQHIRYRSPAPIRRSSIEERLPPELPISHEDEESASSTLTVETSKPSQEQKPSSPPEFHEFAASPAEEEEWVNEQPDTSRKITINDTLEKEIKIRQIGEEAEQEALEEANEEEEAEEEEEEGEIEDEEVELDEDDDDEDLDDNSDGNETDNEAGFADSDSESDGDSEYQFWTPSLATAATSMERLDSILSEPPHRVSSSSSIESMIRQGAAGVPIPKSPRRPHRRQRAKMLPGTPELPDSTDFVCGTLDEDRPLEEAYVSCLEQRKKAKHIPVPQDIDPSFPTTDDEDEEEYSRDVDEHLWIPGQMEDAVVDEGNRGRPQCVVSSVKSPILSPRKYHSPPPIKRNRSPSRRLFGSLRLPRSPPPSRHIQSPPPSRRVSLTTSPTSEEPKHIQISGLASRPNLVHSSSLPRTPNPFFDHQLECPAIADGERSPRSKKMPIHLRGPEDIFIGLEKKRWKRREKYYRLHARMGWKEPRCQPGEGVVRMKELGLEIAGRGKRPALMLSI